MKIGETENNLELRHDSIVLLKLFHCNVIQVLIFKIQRKLKIFAFFPESCALCFGFNATFGQES